VAVAVRRRLLDDDAVRGSRRGLVVPQVRLVGRLERVALLLLLHLGEQLVGGVEDAVCGGAAHDALVVLLVLVERAALAKVVLALGNHGVLERLAAEEARERDLLLWLRWLLVVLAVCCGAE